ncbi:MAG TPA: DUF4238 domain-containing protein [Solirubrobacterales bacterium]|nr:DUF4238 domain-containing protein [Solirubrobacterales bacterium]
MKNRQRKRQGRRRAHHAKTTRTPDRPSLIISGKDCPEVNNGHIVPRMYQAAWEVESRLVAMHERGRPGCRARSTKIAGARGPYYRRVRPQGSKIDDIEASLAYIESRSAKSLRELIAGEPITVERKGAVAQLFGAQMMRGPAFFEQHEELLRPMIEDAQASDFKPRHLASVGGDLELARRKVIDVLLSPTYSFITMLTYAVKVSGVLALMRWHVLRFKEPALVYSDHPVVLWPMNVPATRPFRRQGLGPLTMLEIRVPIAPDVAILMNWIDRSDEVGVPMKRSAAAELNAFTVAQAEREWMHQLGAEPDVGEGVFMPLSRLIDPTYDLAAARDSARRAHAAKFLKQASRRKWVNKVDVVVDVNSQAALRAA